MLSRAFRESTSASVHACQWVISTRSGRPLRCVWRCLQVLQANMWIQDSYILQVKSLLLNLLQGMKWFLLANEEVPSMIMSITGRRGRPPNPDKEPRSCGRRAQVRRPGRPPKPKMEDLLSKVDARLLKRLEAKGESEYSYQVVYQKCTCCRSTTFFIFSHFIVLAFYVKYNEHLRSIHVHCFTEDLTEEEKEKLIKIKKKMKRKVSWPFIYYKKCVLGTSWSSDFCHAGKNEKKRGCKD